MTISKSKLISILNSKYASNKEIHYNVYKIINNNAKECINEIDNNIRINFNKLNEKVLRLIENYINNIEQNVIYEEERNKFLKDKVKIEDIQDKRTEIKIQEKTEVDIIEHVTKNFERQYGVKFTGKLNEDTILEDMRKHIKLMFRKKYGGIDKKLRRKNKQVSLHHKMARNAKDIDTTDYRNYDLDNLNTEELYENVELEIDNADVYDDEPENVEIDYCDESEIDEPDELMEEDENDDNECNDEHDENVSEDEIDPKSIQNLEEENEEYNNIISKAKMIQLFGDDDDSSDDEN